MTAPARRRPRLRAAVLFEVLLSLALFVGAAGFALGATTSVLSALDRAGRDALALDIARAKLAELEAGLVSIAELREGTRGIDRVGSLDPFGADPAEDVEPWEIDVTTARSEFTGLTLVTVTARAAPDGASATLRQLVALGDADAGDDEGYEEDELLRGLPMEAPADPADVP